ncbi:hypothetical protein BDB00DRAFT_879197 [Zychaea mexicana]|uniref:uncharacterized protein n=1 Tax=Zychaea mexicana TaxID=64656 RepID=UPI0022FDD1AE|nr:uncharacterized protein BDB00DRAFT_879197 [Zychaea mexicana]KAI9480237.1 hypothetical protein BDB00DRAFT_879197 [Zychaea mexicana]
MTLEFIAAGKSCTSRGFLAPASQQINSHNNSDAFTTCKKHILSQITRLQQLFYNHHTFVETVGRRQATMQRLRALAFEATFGRKDARGEEDGLQQQPICSNCATSTTPFGVKTILELHNQRRPLSFKSDTIKKRQRVEKTQKRSHRHRQQQQQQPDGRLKE